MRGTVVVAVLLWLAAAAADLTVIEESCARGSFRQLARSCSGSSDYAATSKDPLMSPRVALAAILHACLGSPSSPRPLRIISPTGSYTQPIYRLTAAYSATTQVPVNYITLPLLQYTTSRQSMLLDANPPTNSTGYDALVASATAYGDAAQVPGKLLDLSYLVVNDPVVDWQDIPAALRASMTMYDGKIVALPLAPAAFLTFYRLDIFQRDNLTVPQTWEQFADLAERYHNGPDGLVGACIMPIGCRGESLMLRTIYASYVQTQGHSQGVYWDPETMQPLVASPAMEAALRIFRRLYAVGLTKSHAPNCLMTEFNEGKCLLSIAPGSRFKEANIGDSNVTVVRGRIGVAPLPGSTRVLDRNSMALVPCDKQCCPLAEGAVEQDGVMVPVNRPSTVASAIILINGLSPLQYQFTAYELFALLTASRITDAQTVLLEINDQLPLRLQELSTDYLPLWVKRGYDLQDTTRFLTVYKRVMGCGNVSPDLKIRLTSNVTSALLAAALQYNDPHTPESALPAVLTRLQAVLDGIAAAERSPEAFAQQYRRSLNWVPSATNPPGSAASQQPPPGTRGDDARRRSTTRAVALSVSCGVLLALVAAGAFLLRRHLRLRRQARRGAAEEAPPGVGELTTLVVTDMFESTLLWECLPAVVMDQVLTIHHDIMRETRVACKGFESATEGDSFIIAFKSPSAAVSFCLRAQQALLDAPWPEELLTFTLPPASAGQQPTVPGAVAGADANWNFALPEDGGEQQQQQLACARLGGQPTAAWDPRLCPAGVVTMLPPSRGPRHSDGSSLFMSSNIFEDDGTSSVMSAMPSVLQPQHTAPGYEQPHLQPQPQVMSLSFAPRFASSTPAPRSPQRMLAPQRPAPSMALNTTAAAALQRPAAAVPAGGSSSSPFVAAAGGEGGNSGLATAVAPMIAVASRPAEMTGAEAPADGGLQGAEPPAAWRRRGRLLLAPPPPAPVLLPPTPLPPPAPGAAAQVKADGAIPDSRERSQQQPQEQQKHRPQLGRPPTFGELYPVLSDSGSFTAASPAAQVGPGAGALTAPGSTTSPGAVYTVADGAPTSSADAGPGVPGSPSYGCSAAVLADSAAAAHASATAITSSSRSRGFMLPMPPSAASAIPRPPAAAATSSGGAAVGVCSGVQSSPEGEATMRLLRRSLAAGDVQQVRYTDAASGAFLDLIAAGNRPEAAGIQLPLSLIAPGVEPAPDVDKGAPGLLRPAPSAPPIGEDTLSPRAASSQSTGTGRVLESLPAGRMPGSGSRSRPASGFAWTSGGRWSPGGDLNSVMSRFQRLSHGSHLQQQLQQQQLQQQQQQQQHTPQTLTGVHTSKQQRVASIPNSGGGSRSSGVASRLLAGAAAVRATSGGTLVSHTAADGAGRLLSGATPNALLASAGSPSSPSARTTASEAWRHPVAQPPLLSTASPVPGRGHHLRVPLQGAAGGSGGGLGSLEAHSSRQHYAQASGGRRLPIKAPSAAFLGSTTLGNAVGKTRRALRKTSSAAKLLIRTAAGTPGQLQVLDTAKVLMQGPTTRANAGTAFVVGSPPAALGLPSATGVGSPMQGPSVASMSGAAAGVGGGGPPSTSSVRMRVSVPGSARGAASLAAGSSAGGGMDAAVSAVLAADATTFGELLRLQWCVPSVPPAAAADGRMISLQQQRRRSIGGLTGGAATEPPIKLTPDVGAVTDGMQQVHSSANPGWTAERLSAAAVDAVRMVANVVSPRISLDRPREPLPALPAPSQKSVQAHQSRQSQAGTQRAAAAAAGAAVVFRGIRVRMGLHSQVTTPADLTRNDACGRVQYSGSLLRLAKAVSDVGQGGMVLLSQAARDALQQAAEGESAAALQKALGGPFVLLWMGKHTFADGAGAAHLYQVVSMPLVGRLALQLQQSEQALLRKCAPVPPLGGGVFDAPAAGFGTLARISVVGASTLMAWNAEVTTRALAQMHEMLLGHLTCCIRATCNAVVEEEESSGPDGGVRARVASNNLASCYIVEGAEGLLGSGKSLGRGGRSITAKQKSIFAVSPSPPKGKESMHTQLPPQSGPSTNGRHASSAMQAHSITAANGNAGGLGASSGNTLSGEDARVPSRTALSMSAPSWLHKGSQQQPRASFTAALRQKLRMHITANSNSSPGASPGPGTTPVGSVAALRSDLAVSTSAATAVAAPSSHTKLLPKHSVPGAMTAAWRRGPAQAVHWLLSCLSSLPQMDWPPELLEHPLAEEAWFDGPEGQQPGRLPALHWRGLRTTAVVAWGELSGCLEPGSLSGHMSYQHSTAWQALKRITAASQVGKVVVGADVAAMLPSEQLDHVMVSNHGPISRKAKRGG